MSIKLITGPINAGKTTEMLERFLYSDNSIYVTPLEGTASAVRRKLFKKSNKGALLGELSMSWSKFVHLIANTSDYTISRFHTSLLLMKIIANNHLNYFKTKNVSLGVAKQFADTIIALKKNGVGIDRLRTILDTRGGPKENDLLITFERYESEKKRHNLIDEGDLYSIAFDNVASNVSDFLNTNGRIFIDEFSRFSPGELQTISLIKRQYPQVEMVISFPLCDDQSSLYYDYLNKSFEELLEVADETIIRTCDNSFEPTIRICSARSPLQETRGALHSIASALSTNNLAKDDIALVSRSSSTILDEVIAEIQYLNGDDRLIEHGNMDAPILHKLLSTEVLENWPHEGSFSEYIELCSNLIISEGLISKCINELEVSKTNARDISRSLSAISRIESILQELAIASQYFDLPPIRRESFARILTDRLNSHSPHSSDERHLPFTHIQFESGLTFKTDTVVMPRMLEGSIPMPHGERLFFSESDKLSPDPDDILDRIFTTFEDNLSREAYLFDTFKNKCTGALILTYPIIDDSGSETTKSSFLDAYTEHISIGPFQMMASADVENRNKKLIQIEFNRFSGKNTGSPYQGRIKSNKAKQLIKERFQKQKFSATSLEKYAACPFTFFVEKVLGLEPIEEEMPELIPKDRGTILHAVLECFYKNNSKEFDKYISNPGFKKEISQIVDSIIDNVFSEHENIISGVAFGLKNKQRDMIQTMSMQVIEMEAAESRELPEPLFPLECEWGFGENDVADLEIPVKNDVPAKIHGWIDRIDVDRGKSKYLVLDYKTRSSAKSIKQEILSGLKLQLPIYVEAVRRLLLPNAKPLGGLLIDVMSAEKRHGFVLKEYNGEHYSVGRAHSAMNDDVWNQAIAATLSACSVYVANIRNGIFDVNPKNGCPGYCNYAEICRYYGQGSN